MSLLLQGPPAFPTTYSPRVAAVPTKILIAVPVHSPSLERLANDPALELVTIEPLDEAREVPVNDVEDAQVLFTSMPPTNFEAMSNLHWVQLASAGYSQLYPLNLHERRIRASNALGVFDVPIAEWNIAMMINLARDLRGMIRHQDQAVWDRDPRFQSEIRGAVLGIWGYGGIGRETARLATAMGLNVHVLVRDDIKSRLDDVYRVPGTGDPEGLLPARIYNTEQTEEFLQGLDFLSLSMPLTKSTEGIIGERELRALPSHAFLLNPARGPLIQEQALLTALREGWIAGAALDTHYQYPLPADHPLWQFDNVILTPHISGSSGSPRFLDRVWDIFIQNVRRFLTGKPLINELSGAQLRGD